MAKERAEKIQRVWKEKTEPIVKQIIELCDYYTPCPTEMMEFTLDIRDQVISNLMDEVRAQLKQGYEDYSAIRKCM